MEEEEEEAAGNWFAFWARSEFLQKAQCWARGKTKSDGPELFHSLFSLNLVRLVGTVTHFFTEESKVM